MSGNGCNDDIARGISSQDRYTYFGDDSEEGRQRGMGLGPGGRGIGNHGIYIIREHLRSQKAKIAEYVAGRLIYKLCTRAHQIERSSIFLMWWDQEHGPNRKKKGGILKYRTVSSAKN